MLQLMLELEGVLTNKEKDEGRKKTEVSMSELLHDPLLGQVRAYPGRSTRTSCIRRMRDGGWGGAVRSGGVLTFLTVTETVLTCASYR